MRHSITLFLVMLLPVIAVAQSYPKSPMVVIGGEEAATPVATDNSPKPADALANFPQQAITQVGDEKIAQAAPTAPSKLWPRNTLQIFMPRCTALKEPFIEPCRCVITKLMNAMPHDEFLKKSEEGSIEQDPRLIQIRNECATAPQRKD